MSTKQAIHTVFHKLLTDYQQNTVQENNRKITNIFVESQKDITVISFRLWSYWMRCPKQVAENYFLLFRFYIP